MSRILLCGSFDRQHPGEGALFEAFGSALAGHEVIVTSSRPVPAAETVAPTLRGVASAFPHVDAVVVGGGTVFRSLPRSSGRHPLAALANLRALQAAAGARGIPVALAGVGAGALTNRTAVRLARRVASRADLLVLRDEESAALLCDIGVAGPLRIGADPAWTVSVTAPVWAGNGAGAASAPRRHVVVALGPPVDGDEPRLVRCALGIVAALVSHGVHVRLQPWCTARGIELALARRVRSGSPEDSPVQVVDHPWSMADAVASVRDAVGVVGFDHHALMAAAEAGRPFLAVAQEPATGALARRLQQQSVPVHAPPAVLARAALELLDAVPPATARIDDERVAAHRTMGLLRLVVSPEPEANVGDSLELTGGRPW